MSVAALRAICLFAPLFLVTGLWLWRDPSPKLRTSILVSCCWTALTLCVAHTLAQGMGWWSFQAEGGVLLGFPIDVWIGWTALWGAVPPLAFSDGLVSQTDPLPSPRARPPTLHLRAH